MAAPVDPNLDSIARDGEWRSASRGQGNKAQTVLLVHGLGQSSLFMMLLAKRLRKEGFTVVYWNYRSYWGSLCKHAERLRKLIDERLSKADCGTLHLVGHSLGSILLRKVLAEMPAAQQLGRAVFLGPPNLGSRVARFWSGIIGRICPVLNELSDDPESLVHRLPAVRQFDIGILAARHDLVVAEPNTHLLEERDHRIVDCGHTGLLFHREAAELVACFLREGRFK